MHFKTSSKVATDLEIWVIPVCWKSGDQMNDSACTHPVPVKPIRSGPTRRSHTHAAQAQDCHKEEGAENSASHGVIKAPGGGQVNGLEIAARNNEPRSSYFQNSVHALLCASSARLVTVVIDYPPRLR